MILSDNEIATLCRTQNMITPFIEGLDTRGISFGLGSYGYDIRVGTDFKIFTNIHTSIVDPKNFDVLAFETKTVPRGEAAVIPPNSFALTCSFEWIRVPRDVLVLCLGKSTYARSGIIVNVTPLEPEWEGNVTIEISNTSPLPAKVYAGEGIVQLIFLKASRECRYSYKDRGGKYQGQKGVVGPIA